MRCTTTVAFLASLPARLRLQVKLVLQGGEFELGDRVTCVSGKGNPPFGLRGTVIGERQLPTVSSLASLRYINRRLGACSTQAGSAARMAHCSASRYLAASHDGRRSASVRPPL